MLSVITEEYLNQATQDLEERLHKVFLNDDVEVEISNLSINDNELTLTTESNEGIDHISSVELQQENGEVITYRSRSRYTKQSIPSFYFYH